MVLVANTLFGMMLKCPVKAYTGVDCPGCGFQRSFWVLLQGDVASAWHHYPPMLPFLVTLALVPIAVKTRLPYRMAVLWGGLATTCLFICTNYALKLF